MLTHRNGTCSVWVQVGHGAWGGGRQLVAHLPHDQLLLHTEECTLPRIFLSHSLLACNKLLIGCDHMTSCINNIYIATGVNFSLQMQTSQYIPPYSTDLACYLDQSLENGELVRNWSSRWHNNEMKNVIISLINEVVSDCMAWIIKINSDWASQCLW